MVHSVTRRDLALLLLGAGAWLPAACSRPQGQGTSSKAALPEPLRVGFIGTGEHQPIGAEGWSYKRGLLVPALQKLGFSDVSFIRFANGPDLNEALSGGSLDLGIYGDTPAIVGRAAGLPTRLLNQSVVGLDAWLLVRADGPKTLADLVGKTVATSKGSYMNRYLSGLLLEKNLNDQVKFAHLLPSDAAAALERGDIAAYAAPIATAPLMVAKGARVIDRASDHTGLVGSSVTVIPKSFLAAHPGFPKAWNALRAESVADLKKHLDLYYTWHAETVRVPIEAAKVAYPPGVFASEPLSETGLRLLEGTKSFLLGQKLSQTDFSIPEWALSEALPGR
jgi:NitT/TauT family transport system substrate-binding protein/sulfonate transport system substrate-binding protein